MQVINVSDQKHGSGYLSRNHTLDERYAYDYVQAFYNQSVTAIQFPRSIITSEGKMGGLLEIGCLEHWGPMHAVMETMNLPEWDHIVENLLSKDLLAGLTYRPGISDEQGLNFIKSGFQFNDEIFIGLNLSTPKANLKILDIPQPFSSLFGKLHAFPNLEILGCLSGYERYEILEKVKAQLPHLKEIILYSFTNEGPYWGLPYVRFEKIDKYDEDSDDDDSDED